jgi:hypothetical protein
LTCQQEDPVLLNSEFATQSFRLSSKAILECVRPPARPPASASRSSLLHRLLLLSDTSFSWRRCSVRAAFLKLDLERVPSREELKSILASRHGSIRG